MENQPIVFEELRKTFGKERANMSQMSALDKQKATHRSFPIKKHYSSWLKSKGKQGTSGMDANAEMWIRCCAVLF